MPSPGFTKPGLYHSCTEFSLWTAPVVPVLKKNGKMRLCGDYKLATNQVSLTDTYPLPIIEEFLLIFWGELFFFFN